MKLHIYLDLFRADGGFASYTALVPIDQVPEEGQTLKIIGTRYTMKVVHRDTNGWSTYVRCDGRKGLSTIRRKLLEAGFSLQSFTRATRK